MLRTYIINIISKIGLATPLLYVTALSLISPDRVTSRWPYFFSHHVHETTLALFTALISIGLIIWLFTEKLRFEASIAILASLFFTGIFNLSDTELLFTLVPLFCIALSLSLRYYPRIRVVVETQVTISKEHKDPSTGTSNTPTDHTHTTNDHDQHLFISEHK
jgi:hypothetical protein